MNKLDMESINITDNNIDKIGELFPNVIVESDKGKTIDFDLLKQELSKDIVEGNKEKYQLTWPGKKEAILTANTPTKKTLRPLKEKSVDFDNTENIYIEGDNLEALKILQESYLNKIKCIYIDPPYNTGNDFIYKDNFKKSTNEELLESGQIDEEGNRLVSNNSSNGKFHSDWLSMMYPRLKLARNLLKDDGVIFISIGQNEIDNTIKIVKEIFGENNYLSTISRVTKKSSNSGDYFAPSVDYVIVATKKTEQLNTFRVEMSEELATGFKFNDEKGKYKLVGFYQASLELSRSRFARYYIETPDGHKCIPPENKRWRTIKETYDRLFNENRIVFKETNTSPLLDENGNKSKWNVYTKSYQNERAIDGYVPREYIEDIQNNLGTIELGKINIPFSFAKPSKLIKYLMSFDYEKDEIIMDFFSGSATTADAVMQFNRDKKTKIRYLLVQLPEITNEEKFKTICDIGEERIKRVAKKIKEETNADIDYGFRVYKIDSSNMKNVYYKPSDLKQEQLNMFESNIKEDRTSEDLLTQVILDLGLTLDLKIEEKNILNNKLYFVDNNSLIACFDDNININIVDEICKYKPLKVVFKDSSFKYDNDKINLEERFKKLSSETEISIL